MAGPSSVAGDVFVDALPYFDQGYDAPGVREAVSKQTTFLSAISVFKSTNKDYLTSYQPDRKLAVELFFVR